MADPVLTDFETSYAFDENAVNAAPVILDSAVFFDNDADNFDGGTLVIRVDTIFPDQIPGHLFYFAHEGDGEGQVGIDGLTVSFSGVVIGTIAYGASMVVTFNDAATDTAIGHLIEALTYQYTLDDPPAAVSFMLEVEDEDGDLLEQAFTINLTPENDAPVAVADAFTVDEDGVLIGNVLDDNGSGADFDPDGAPPPTAKAETVTSARGVSVAIATDGSFVYLPPIDAVGTDTFVYTVMDSNGAESQATATIEITPVNDNPLLVSGPALTIAENNTFVAALQAIDIDSSAVSYALVGGADQALFTLTSDGRLAFAKAPDFEKPTDNGADNTYDIVVAVSDGDGGQSTQALSVTVTDLNEIPGTKKDDTIKGTEGDDDIDGGKGNDKINGQDGDDWIKGGPGKNILKGGGGKDRIEGGKDQDKIKGGADDDNLKGGGKKDNISGDEGNDVIYGGKGNDKVEGGPGDDFIKGGAGKNTLKGEGGKDLIEGGKNKDKIKGGADDDTLKGAGQKDDIKGGGGNDIIDGGKGNDKLKGGKGDDVLKGGQGRNILDGGDGKDTYVFDFKPKTTTRKDANKIKKIGPDDKLALKSDVFDAFEAQAGKIREDQFATGKKAKTESVRILYDEKNKVLKYDPDGNGDKKAVVLATIEKVDGDITADDFLII